MKWSRLVLLAELTLLVAPACSVGGSGGIGAVSCGGGVQQSSLPEVQLITPQTDQSTATIQVVNVNPRDLAALRSTPPTIDEWQALLRVTVVPSDDTRQADNPERPAVAGNYSIVGDAIVFKPMFGFDPGLHYRAALNRAKLPSLRNASQPPGGFVDVKEVWLPKPDVQATTIVDHVYPSSEVVPENQLRLYIHFSAPMGLKPGLAYIKLLDEAGHEVEDPFLPLDTDLWSGDRTRFTVFFDPGRMKRGILPNKEMGRSLTAGKTYTLIVSQEWPDGQGLPLKETFRRTFKVGPPDEKPLDQHTWRIQAPRAGSRDPLAISFPEPLDHGLLVRALGVLSASGSAVDGQTEIESGDMRWTFTPREAWKQGDYRLRVLTILEDLAGNRIGRAFEVDQFERADRESEPDEIAIAFRVM